VRQNCRQLYQPGVLWYSVNMEAEAPISPSRRSAKAKKAGKVLVFVVAGVLLGAWLLNTPPGLLGKADAIAYAVCHRIDLRSFHIGERPISLCARCSGMYLGALLSLAYQHVVGRRRAGMPPLKVAAVLVVLALAFAFDGINSYLSLLRGTPLLYEPHNTLRLITGTGMGLAIAAMLYPAFNQTAWKELDFRPALGNFKHLAGLLALSVVPIALVLTENPLILYPLALISAAGVLILLTLVYTMVWLMLWRRENRYQRVRQLLVSFAGGFILALLQIALIDVGRYVLTGTWEGFHVLLG
jgi:uncharacterized membrane protein